MAAISRVWGIAMMWPSIRRGATTSVLRFDLEHFKRLNDERGLAAVLLRDTTL
jgi:GGDEF domain-containing protein